MAKLNRQQKVNKIRGVPDGSGPYGRGVGPGGGRHDGSGLKSKKKVPLITKNNPFTKGK